MKLLQEGFYVNRHSCFILQYHLVLVTKYRHPVITGELETILLEPIVFHKQRKRQKRRSN